MKNICFTFQVHQPFRLRNFHFFEIGDHYNYFDEETNARIMRQIAERSYLPTNKLLLDLIHTYSNKIKLSFLISGTALDQMEHYVPEVLESFNGLAATGNVEFLGQTYTTSLSSLKSTSAFHDEVLAHRKRITKLFGKRPRVFVNTGLVYSDDIGKMISDMGFKAVIVEGLPSVLKGKSPNNVYESASKPSLNLLLRNQSLSDDIAFRFSEQTWSERPLTSEKYLGWLSSLPVTDEVVNLVMDYGTFGAHQNKDTGIFSFLKYLLCSLAESKDLRLGTPGENIRILSPKGKLKVSKPISWTGQDMNSEAWLGNEMQQEACDTLYSMEDSIKNTKDKHLKSDWERLKSADHFLYMNNQNEAFYRLFNPYESPYDAFLKYMNVLADLQLKLDDKNKKKSKSRNARSPGKKQIDDGIN
jgi:alpha-amylase